MNFFSSGKALDNKVELPGYNPSFLLETIRRDFQVKDLRTGAENVQVIDKRYGTHQGYYVLQFSSFMIAHVCSCQQSTWLEFLSETFHIDHRL